MSRKEMSLDQFGEMLSIRLKEVRNAPTERQAELIKAAWEMVQRDVPWEVVLSATRAGNSAPIKAAQEHRESVRHPSIRLETFHAAPQQEALSLVEPADLASNAPPPIRREAGRQERERLSSNTRRAIRNARCARRWHEIRKMRNVLLNIDQGYLKRMLGAESEVLNQEINALLRSWAPLIREHQQGGRVARRR